MTERDGRLLLALDSHLSLAAVLRQTDGVDSVREIEAALERANELAAATGADSRIPAIQEERGRLAELRSEAQEARAQLREAQRLYEEMSAVGHATRLKIELADVP